VKVKWLGHASFLITAADGTRILTDPFGDYPGLRYKPVQETADLVLVSHDHGDHVGGKVTGSPKVVSKPGVEKARGIEVKGIATFHDRSRGKERGKNTIFCFTVDDLRVCHLGDLGHDLSGSETAEIGQVDVMMVPVGGLFTIDAGTASAVCDRIGPRVVLPMHYKSDKCDFPIAGVDEFIKGKANVRTVDGSEVEITRGQLPAEREIIVLDHAL
jgi:L-ascorbate metabolism protein UlaG (beta-lactamase superfamily)